MIRIQENDEKDKMLFIGRLCFCFGGFNGNFWGGMIAWYDKSRENVLYQFDMTLTKSQ